MANMREVNQYIKTNYPGYHIQVVRGDGYVYFDGDDGFDKIPSIMVHAPSLTTSDLTEIVLEEIQSYLLGEGLPLEKTK